MRKKVNMHEVWNFHGTKDMCNTGNLVSGFQLTLGLDAVDQGLYTGRSPFKPGLRFWKSCTNQTDSHLKQSIS